MGNVAGSAVEERRVAAVLPGYERLGGVPPLVYPPELGERAAEAQDVFAAGSAALSEILGVEPPELEALLVADADWTRAPRENERPYPPG
ncbi:MAG TPA: hypothetical protein VGP74_05380, partial [Rubrobacteraceae bacterium]|nr:hypothetical protein [Rubrobacteraceae bacterium]